MPSITDRLIDWLVRFMRAANIAAKDREVPFFLVLFAISIYWKHYTAAAAIAGCIAICQFLASYELNRGPLPTREAFLNSVPKVDTENKLLGQECPVCYDDAPEALARLSCCGHELCSDCLQLVYGPDHRDNRCPTCRQPLFRVRAPWNATPIKLGACRAWIGVVEFGLDFAATMLGNEPEGRVLYWMSVTVSPAAFLFCCAVLVFFWLRMDALNAGFWREIMPHVVFWPALLLQILPSLMNLNDKMEKVMERRYHGPKELMLVG